MCKGKLNIFMSRCVSAHVLRMYKASFRSREHARKSEENVVWYKKYYLELTLVMFFEDNASADIVDSIKLLWHPRYLNPVRPLSALLSIRVKRCIYDTCNCSKVGISGNGLDFFFYNFVILKIDFYLVVVKAFMGFSSKCKICKACACARPSTGSLRKLLLLKISSRKSGRFWRNAGKESNSV